MIKHYLEAFINEKDEGFRLICTDIKECSREQEYPNACLFQDQWKEFNIDMLRWTGETVLGRTEVKLVTEGILDTFECWIEAHDKKQMEQVEDKLIANPYPELWDEGCH